MARKNKNLFPQSGKCDLIERILLGGVQTKALSKKNKCDKTPRNMIKKLCIIQQETSCCELREKATQVIELLEKLPKNTPVRGIDRKQILKTICD